MREKILIITNDTQFRGTTSEKLKEQHFIVTNAVSGQSGFNKAIALVPDTILLESNMPDTSGYQVLSLLRSKKETQSIPVIMLCDQINEDQVKKSIVKGVSDFILKNSDFDIIHQKIVSLLDSRKNFQIYSEKFNKWMVLEVQGDFKIQNYGEIHSLFANLISDGKQFICLNFSTVTGIDSKGITLLIELYKFTSKNKGILALINPNQQISKVLTVTKIFNLLSIYPSRKAFYNAN